MQINERIQKIDDDIMILKDRMTKLQTEIYLSKKDEILSNELQNLLDDLRREWRKKILEKCNLEKEIMNCDLKGGMKKW